MAASGGVPQQGAGADNSGNGNGTIGQPTDNPPTREMEFTGTVNPTCLINKRFNKQETNNTCQWDKGTNGLENVQRPPIN